MKAINKCKICFGINYCKSLRTSNIISVIYLFQFYYFQNVYSRVQSTKQLCLPIFIDAETEHSTILSKLMHIIRSIKCKESTVQINKIQSTFT